MELILVRHGFSISNENKSVHTELADHKIPLSGLGHIQASQAAVNVQKYLINKYENRFWGLGKLCRPKIGLWSSPYLRTRQTAKPFKSLCWSNGSPLFVSYKEDVALIEQQFGLFDGLSDEELQSKFPHDFAHYAKCERHEGKFYARMPLGESRLDVVLRTHQLFGSWHRDAKKHNINTLVVIAHGVTIRAIIMRWLHLSVEWFEQEINPPNCSIRIIDNGKDIGYLL